MSRPIIRRPVETAAIGNPPLLQRIYAARGIASLNDLERGLIGLLPYHDLLGIEQAAACLGQALMQQQRILIIGDFDVDGATSSALAVRGLRALGAQNVNYLIPNRFMFGHGLTPEIVAVAAQQQPAVIMTVDNGIASVAGVAAAKAAGIQVVITDHHLAGETLPAADAIVNPNQPGDPFPSKHLAGVGVCFYVLLALRAHLMQCGWFAQLGIEPPNMAQFLDLVALGTVADVVTLDKNNRILVHQGVQRIRARKCCPGILALLDVGNRQAAKCQASDLGFTIAPRLNAAGRLDDMSLGVACLISDEREQARTMAAQLEHLNQERRAIEREMQKQALAALDKKRLTGEIPLGLCLFDETWHQGVSGIIAGRLKEQFHRPVIVFAAVNDTEIKGSGRSVSGLHIRDVLEAIAKAHPQMLEKFGGHAMAAGLTILRQDFQTFSQAFNAEVEKRLSKDRLNGEIYTDGELQAEEFTMQVARSIQDGGPWGQGFPEPLFDGCFKVLGQRLVADKHLKLSLSTGPHILDGIAFNVNTYHWPNQRAEQIRAAYRLAINEFNQQASVQLIVEYLEPL